MGSSVSPQRLEARRPASPRRARRRRGPWLKAVLLALAGMALLQLGQHEFLMGLPMFWYHAVATVLSAIVVTVTGVLYIEWHAAALRAEDALRDLLASEALREDMTHMLVHDLKNPLTASLGCSQLLLAQGTALSDTDRELLDMSVESQTRLVGMIGDLLDIARAEGGAMPLSIANTDVGSSIGDVLAEAGLAAEQHGLELVPNIGGCPPVPCDGEKVRRVVANLLANAIKHTPRGGRITMSLREVDGEALVTVSDTGVGIPESMHARIFDKFGQVGNPGDGQRMSVGLGLAFCRLAVEAHGGRIWVDSRPGRGSTFSFALPLGPRSEGPIAPANGSPGGMARTTPARVPESGRPPSASGLGAG